MAWKRAGRSEERYIKFVAGTSIEGIFTKRGSHEYDKKHIFDIYLDVNGEEKVLGTQSQNLIDTFVDMKPGTAVRIEMISKGGKKLYNVYVDDGKGE
jgi:hypothetical protein